MLAKASAKAKIAPSNDAKGAMLNEYWEKIVGSRIDEQTRAAQKQKEQTFYTRVIRLVNNSMPNCHKMASFASGTRFAASERSQT